MILNADGTVHHLMFITKSTELDKLYEFIGDWTTLDIPTIMPRLLSIQAEARASIDSKASGYLDDSSGEHIVTVAAFGIYTGVAVAK